MIKASFLILLLLTLVVSGVPPCPSNLSLLSPTRKISTPPIKIDDVYCNSLLIPHGGGQPTTTIEKLPLPKGTYSTGKILEIHKGTWLPVALAFMYRFNNYNYRSCLIWLCSHPIHNLLFPFFLLPVGVKVRGLSLAVTVALKLLHAAQAPPQRQALA